MTTNQTPYPSAAGLIGNVSIERNTFPTIRASIRRLNPDGASSVPYYPSASGKVLKLFYTTEPSVDSVFVSITLTGNSIAQIITDINGAVPGVIQASELDGFLIIRNLNPGKTHFLSVVTVFPSSNNAAPILGFPIVPFPGSTSYAGEYAPAPSNRKEANPQTTALIASDEDLSAKTFNRSFYALLQLVETMRADLARDVVVYKDVFLNTTTHTGSAGFNTAKINDDDIKLFYPESDTPTVADLNQFYRVLDSGRADAVSDSAHAAVQVNGLFYTTALIPISTSVFSTWLTPDGGSIVSTTTKNKDKHSSTAITSIIGNIVFCASATFLTNKIKAGDPVQLTASNLQPFDHSGWYAVDAVIDDTHLAIRPMSIAEQTPVDGDPKPRWMNPSAGGTLRIALGRFIPAGDVFLSTTTSGSFVCRLAVGVPFHSTIVDDQARGLSGTLNLLATKLYAHITNTTDAHAATAISGFTSATTWRDGTTITGVNLRETIENILTDLKAQASSDSGSGRIGAEAISIGGLTPNTLASGTVLSQLAALLTDIRDHINQTVGSHAAQTISCGIGPLWADNTPNPATTVQLQLDKIVSDLATTGGASKIRYDGGPIWADATANPTTTIENQLDKIITDLGGSGGAAKIGYGGGDPWADGTTNPATRVETQLDKIIIDLAASTGSAKIGGAASGTDIAAATLATQIANLAVNWLKMSRANTISGAQTFSALLTSAAITASGLITANGGLTTSSGITYTGSADEHFPDREFSVDCSAFQIAGQGFHNGAQGELERPPVDGINNIIAHSLVVGAGNSSGQTNLVTTLSRIRVGDKITSIVLSLASTHFGAPNNIGVLVLQANSGTSTSDTDVFTSGNITWPTAGTIAEQTFTINYTHITGDGLRLIIRTFATSAGQPAYVRYARVKFQRP